MAQPKYAMGQLITNVLIDRIMGGHLPLRRELLQTDLVVRQSTAPLL
jgi:DNA-binding LacI/PurR family transcriptional regulator